MFKYETPHYYCSLGKIKKVSFLLNNFNKAKFIIAKFYEENDVDDIYKEVEDKISCIQDLPIKYFFTRKHANRILTG